MNAIFCRLPALMPLALVLCLGGCALSDPGSEPDRFEPGPAGVVKPWTATPFDNHLDKFTFAVFSDLTGGERPGVFQVAMEQMSLLRPEFIINVGDLIEGETGDRAEAVRQWEQFDQPAETTTAPVFYVGGNHDLNSELLQDLWAERLGPRYYHFTYRNTLFLVLDSEDHDAERTREILAAREQALTRVRAEGNWSSFSESSYAQSPENKAGTISSRQAAYFTRVLDQHPDVRWTFVFVHKAPWLRDDATAYHAIETALSARPYTLFHGHEHVLRHQRRQGRDYIQLATTGGVQFQGQGLSADMITLVTLGESEPSITHLRMDGILNKRGEIPGNGEALCFELARCGGD